MQIDVEFRDNLARLQSSGVSGQALYQTGERTQQCQVFFDYLAHSRTKYLDGHLASIVQYGEMHLCDRCRCDRVRIELLEQGIRRCPQSGFNQGSRLIRGEWRHLVLQ